MADVPEGKRCAHFTSVVCLITEGGQEIFGEGRCTGKILHERSGNGGFGYDPVFYSDDYGKSFGDLSHEQKNEISHRKRALVDLLQKL